MEGNLSGERFPSFDFLHLCCGIRLIGKAEWWEPLPRGRSGNVMKRRGGSQRSIRMAPSSFSYERRLGALVPIWFFELYLFALQGKKFTSRGPIQRHVSSGSVGGLAVKGNAAQVKGASLASAWLSPCGVQGKRPCQYFGRSLWVRPRFRLASVRASVCRPVCWKGP